MDDEGTPPTWNGMPLQPLAGGYSGETFLVGDGADSVVLRVYHRNPGRCVVDAALLRLVAGLLPVPRVLEQRPATDGRPGVLVTERLPGERLDQVLPRLSDPDRERVGRHLGQVLARLSGIPMPRFGMLDGDDLRVTSDDVPVDLVEWAHAYRTDGRLAGWADRDFEDLLVLCDDAEDLLAGDEVPRHVLAHSDFNPKNLLVDPGTLEVTGLLDWEFAFAGSPYADLGNLTRFERDPTLVSAVVDTLAACAPPLGSDPLRKGRAVDLWALVELAGGGRPNAVRDLAADLLRAQARERNLDAWPWPGQPRAAP